MGKSITPKYRIEIRSIPYIGINPPQYRGQFGHMLWDCKHYGKPTSQNLDKWVEETVKAFKPEFLNVGTARIVNQFTGEIEAVYQAPMFQVIE